MPEPLSSPNPYAAPAPEEFELEVDEFLRFDGVMTEAGYRSLLPLGSEQIMVWGLLFLLPLGAALLVGAIGFLIFVEGDWLSTIPFIAFLMVWCGALYGAIWLVNPVSRSQRYLKANPDLLGVARGAFHPHGLMFYDGRITHWFSWLALANTKAMPDGLRVPTGPDPARYLALTADLFLAYSPHYARALIKRYAESVSTHEELIQSSALAFGQKADNERFFAGWVNHIVPYNTRQELLSLIPALSGAAAIIAFSNRLIPSKLALLVFIGVTLFVIGAWCLRRYRRTGRPETTYVWGWVLADQLIYATGQTAMQIPLAEFQNIELTETHVSFRRADRAQVTAFADHFSRPKIWQALSSELSQRFAPASA